MSDGSLPKFALAVRQPWAWAIIFGGKDVENRDWKKSNHDLKFRGHVCIHASAGMTRGEYLDAAESISRIGAKCPPPLQLLRGGIIGTVEVFDVVSEMQSPWFFGPIGLALRNPKACDFIPITGQLGYFDWRNSTPSRAAPSAKWMRDFHRIAA